MSVILPGGKRIASRKRCSECKRVRPLEKFHRASTGYFQSYCRDCKAVRQARWLKKNPKKFLKIQRRYFAKLKRLGVKRVCDAKKKASPVPETQ